MLIARDVERGIGYRWPAVCMSGASRACRNKTSPQVGQGMAGATAISIASASADGEWGFDLADLMAPGGPAAMGLEKKSEPLPKEMWPSLPRATSFLGASSSTIALKANRLGAASAVQPRNRTAALHQRQQQDSAATAENDTNQALLAAGGKREPNGRRLRCREHEGMQWEIAEAATHWRRCLPWVMHRWVQGGAPPRASGRRDCRLPASRDTWLQIASSPKRVSRSRPLTRME